MPQRPQGWISVTMTGTETWRPTRCLCSMQGPGRPPRAIRRASSGPTNTTSLPTSSGPTAMRLTASRLTLTLADASFRGLSRPAAACLAGWERSATSFPTAWGCPTSTTQPAETTCSASGTCSRMGATTPTDGARLTILATRKSFQGGRSRLSLTPQQASPACCRWPKEALPTRCATTAKALLTSITCSKTASKRAGMPICPMQAW